MNAVLQTQHRTIAQRFISLCLSLSGYDFISPRLTVLDRLPACAICLPVCLPACLCPPPPPKHLASNAVHFIPEMSEKSVIPQGSRVQLSVQEAPCVFSAAVDLDASKWEKSKIWQLMSHKA